ncbi:MAG: Uncharacterized protein AUREO_042310 [Aureobasidium pullulans]|nr:MAG: Uncharacterized protein AUREO_042310 [Aureobasidium pullulans]
MVKELQAKAKAGGTKPHELLSIKSLFGDDLRKDEKFIKEITTAMELIAKEGIMATLPKEERYNFLLYPFSLRVSHESAASQL